MADERARRLRREMTKAERVLWSQLRDRRLDAHRVRRQHPLGPWIVDFVCLEKRLVIEIDGGHHTEAEQAAYDRRRTIWLEEAGYAVLRFFNSDVLGNLNGVAQAIWHAVAARPSFARTRRSSRRCPPSDAPPDTPT